MSKGHFIFKISSLYIFFSCVLCAVEAADSPIQVDSISEVVGSSYSEWDFFVEGCCFGDEVHSSALYLENNVSLYLDHYFYFPSIKVLLVSSLQLVFYIRGPPFR